EEESRDASLVFYDSNPGDQNLIRKVRHSITHASDARLGELKANEARERGLPTDSKDLQTRRVGFDVAVPLHAIDAFADRWSHEVARDFPELEMHLFGHLGVGGFHIHHRGPMPGPTKERLFAAMAAAVTHFRGTISAEHGVGPLWTPLFLAHADTALKADLTALFARRDPMGILSPRSFGKRRD
ncbi:MAG TPA: FAD-linked oxidase C-terminal domain-containing protein, partial [Planctomycetota bacterium]|nr:FAD-linked oxidase C-terminal domain-containing protein [Planctomycetota bacterium]